MKIFRKRELSQKSNVDRVLIFQHIYKSSQHSRHIIFSILFLFLPFGNRISISCGKHTHDSIGKVKLNTLSQANGRQVTKIANQNVIRALGKARKLLCAGEPIYDLLTFIQL